MSGDVQFQIGRLLVASGVVLLILGLIFMAASKFFLPTLGKLPGDIAIKNKNFTFYFPFATCAIVSILFTLVLWVISLLSRK